jgi:hypothetical protein
MQDTNEGEPRAMNEAEQTVAWLEANRPAYQVWIVRRATQPAVWCARRWDETGDVLRADSADELAGLIDQAGERPAGG